LDDERYDACIVGSGAAGAVAAYTMARRGLRVLVLEEGDRTPTHQDFRESQRSREGAYAPAGPGPAGRVGIPWSARAFGGGTAFYAAISLRYRERDFDAGNHVSPDAMDPRWPIGYQDLRADFDEIEQLIGVARRDGADPTEPPSPPASLPPHPYSAQAARLAAAASRLGRRPFPTPLSINSVPYRGFPACEQLTPCNGYQCPIAAKTDAVTRFLLPQHFDGQAPTVRLRAKAVRIVQTRATRVEGVEWVDLTRRSASVARARAVVLAGNAVQSAALLLRSRGRYAPTGLGNQHDVVGRGLSFKVSGYVTSIVDDDGELTAKRYGPYSTVTLTDWYEDGDCPGGLGGIVYDTQPDDSAGVATGKLRAHFLIADQPMWRNRLRLSKRRNQLGLHYLSLEYRTHPLDRARARYMARRVAELMREAGGRDVTNEPSHYERGSGHLHGACRAGTDPATSVVDRNGRLHGVDNVWVVDGGYLPYAGAVNPTLTIQANARRIAKIIAGALAQPWS
jgi:paromamine 6'-oxidase/6'''-hydroxyneomycin C oxidase/2'-deamino-2'-hydroxyparomamine 6'-oxidase